MRYDDGSTVPPSVASSAKGDSARLLSRATSTATAAARSVLANGGSEETALKTAKAAAQSVLAPKANENDSVSAKSASFLRRRRARRQAEVVASMALVSAANHLNGSVPMHGSYQNSFEWETGSIPSGITQTAGLRHTTRELTDNGGSTATQRKSSGRSLQAYFDSQQAQLGAHRPPPPPPPPPSQQREAALKRTCTKGDTSQLSSPSRGSAASRPSLPPRSPRQSFAKAGSDSRSQRQVEDQPRSPVKEVIARNMSYQEQVDSAAERLVNGQGIVSNTPRSISRVESKVRDSRDSDEDPIYYKEDTDSSRGGFPSEPEDSLAGLDLSSFETKTEDGTTEDGRYIAGRMQSRGCANAVSSYDSAESTVEKNEPFLSSITSAFDIFKCTPFGFQHPAPMVRNRTDHRGRFVPDRDDGRDETDAEEGSVLTDNTGRDFVSVYSNETDSHHEQQSVRTTSTGTGQEALGLSSSSSEAEIKVQSSFLETLERVVLGSGSNLSTKREPPASRDETNVGEAASNRQNAPQSSPRELPPELPQPPLPSPRNDPDATVVKKKKKGWFRGTKSKLSKSFKKSAGSGSSLGREAAASQTSRVS